MVRTVKAKPVRSLKKGELAVLMPAPTGAEPWEVWLLGGTGATDCVQVCPTPRDNRLRKNTTLALPVAQVYCLPLWLNETDPKLFAGMIPLQLELRGLQPRGSETAVFDWSVVVQEGTRTLVMVGILPATLSPEVQAESYTAFDLSARYLPFPENALTLWKEQDRLAVAITRGPELAYCQVLAEGVITTRVMQDLNCIRTTLEMQGVVQTLSHAVVWAELSTAERATLQSGLQVPLKIAECPPPRPPASVWRLVPAVVSEARRGREIRRWQGRAFLLAFFLYLVVLGWMASQYFLLSAKVDALKKWQTEHATAIGMVRETRASWNNLSLVVNTDAYPLELLLHTWDAIPVDQLHLTLFEVSGDHLLIKGEAKNASAAFQFLDKLKNDPHLTGYSWSMGQPHLLPNDLAQLQIEGTRASSN